MGEQLNPTDAPLPSSSRFDTGVEDELS
jgi:hypothetical protein